MRIDRIKLVTTMLKQDISAKMLAEKTGVSRVTITSIKAGKSCCLETAVKLAAGLGMNVEELQQEA